MAAIPVESDSSREFRLNSLIASFLRSRDAGEHPNVASLITDHPDLARDLREFFRDLGVIDGTIASALPDPPMIGGYRIVRPVSRGSGGDVYEATADDGRRVALKVLRFHRLIDAEERTRFETEAATIARLDHPNVARLIDSGDDSGTPYLAMPFIEGEDLAKAVRRLDRGRKAAPSKTPTSPDRQTVGTSGLQPIAAKLVDACDPMTHARAVAAIGVQAARGLAHAHSRGVLHRDIKPSNLILAVEGTVYLTDFGLARTNDHPDLTRTGDVAGTLRFLAPERFRRWADPWSDQYSLGLTLYELLTLKPAFPDRDRVRLMKALVQARPIAPRRIDPSIPRDLETIVLKTIAPESSDRYDSADSLADDLEQFLAGRPILARRMNPVRRAWGWVVHHKPQAAAIAMIVSVIVGSLVIAFASEVRRRRHAEQTTAETQFQNVLLQIQKARTSSHMTGWRDAIWKLAKGASPGHNDIRLRDEVVASMGGLDSKVFHEELSLGESSIAFDPTGRWLVIGGSENKGQDGCARIWDQQTNRTEPFRLQGPGVVGFLDKDRPVELIAKDGTLELWDLRADRPIGQFKLSVNDRPTTTAVGPGANQIAATIAGRVHIWDRMSGKTWSFPEAATVLRFSPDGRLLGCGDKDGNVVVWSLDKSYEVARFRQERTQIHSMAIGFDVEPDINGRRDWILAVGTTGGGVFVYKVYKEGSGREIASFRGCDYDVDAVEFSPDGTILVAIGLSRHLIWDLATGERLLSIAPLEYPIGLCFSPDGDLLASVPRQNVRGIRTIVQRFENGRGIRTLRGLNSSILCIAFSPNESLIAALTQDWKLGIWEARSGKLLMRLAVTPGETADNATFAFSPDNHSIAFSAGESAELWDLETGRKVRSWPLPSGLVDQLVFAAPDRLLSLRAEHVKGKGSPWIGKLRNLMAKNCDEPFGLTPEFSPRIHVAACSRDGRIFVIEGDEAGAKPPRHIIVALDGSTGKVVLTRITDFSIPGSTLEIDPTGRILLFMAEFRSNGVTYRRGLRDLVTGREEIADYDLTRGLGPLGDPHLRVDSLSSTIMGAVFGLHYRTRGMVAHFGLADPLSHYPPAFSLDGHTLVLGGNDGRVQVVDLSVVRRNLDSLGLSW